MNFHTENSHKLFSTSHLGKKKYSSTDLPVSADGCLFHAFQLSIRKWKLLGMKAIANQKMINIYIIDLTLISPISHKFPSTNLVHGDKIESIASTD